MSFEGYRSPDEEREPHPLFATLSPYLQRAVRGALEGDLNSERGDHARVRRLQEMLETGGIRTLHDGNWLVLAHQAQLSDGNDNPCLSKRDVADDAVIIVGADELMDGISFKYKEPNGNECYIDDEWLNGRQDELAIVFPDEMGM